MKKIAWIMLMSFVLVFLADCVADRQPATAPLPPSYIIGGGKIVGNYYIHEEKGYIIAIPHQEWVANSSQILDVVFKNERGGGWLGTAAIAMPKSFLFEDVNSWWVSGISAKFGWTDIKIIDERDLTIAGHKAKAVVFEFTSRNRRQVDMTYHIWKPAGTYNLYRVRMTCFKGKFEEFLDVFKAFVNSFSFGNATYNKQQSSEKAIEALNVRFIPNPTDVHSSPGRKKRYSYMWYYRTEVKNNLNVPLRINNYGFYFYENRKWVLRTIARQTLTSADFTKRFTDSDRVVDGWIKPGKVAANSRTFVGFQYPVAPRSKWMFAAEDPEGNVYHVEAEIELIPIIEKPPAKAKIDSAAATQISGKVICSGGIPPVYAQVRLTNFQGNYQQSLQTVVAGKDGQFALRVTKPGLYRLFIFAVGHDRFSIPIILDEESQDFKLDIQPAPLNYDEQFTDKKLPFVDFGRQNARLQKVWNIDRTVQKKREAFGSAVGAYRKTHEDLRDFQFDWSETLAMLMRHMQDESDLLVRQSAAIQLGQLNMYGAKIKSATFLEILEHLPPSSEIWSALPHIPSRLASYYGRAMEKKLLNTFVEENPDRVVRGISLAQLAMKAQFEDDKEMVARYYEKLKSEYGDLKEIQHQLTRLNPDKLIMAGKKMPDFEVKIMSSNEVISNKSLMGKFYLMDFWAVWCKPCIQEMKNLHATYEKFKSKNFSILSLSFDQKQEDVVKFRQGEWKMPWLHTFIEGDFNSKMAQTFEVFSIPKPILVGPDGLVLEVGSALRGEALNKTLAKYLIIDEVPK